MRELIKLHRRTLRLLYFISELQKESIGSNSEMILRIICRYNLLKYKIIICTEDRPLLNEIIKRNIFIKKI